MVVRPPGERIPTVDRDKMFAPDSPFTGPFPLFVRQFGSDESAAQRLIGLIQAWEAAGRPSMEGMHIQVYPKDSEYFPSKGELVIEKQWTKLVVAWADSS